MSDSNLFSDEGTSGSFVKSEDLPDGSSVYTLAEEQAQESAPIPFDSNLAEHLSAGQLGTIAQELLEGINQDLESRQEWENTIEKVLKYLGFKVDEYRTVPFMRACGAYDSTLGTTLIDFWATARSELFPVNGPVGARILGEVTPEKEEQGDRVKKFLNYYLTQMDKEYYPDSEKLLLYVGFFGCAFRKVYQDFVQNRPVARFIKPYDLIVNNNTTSLMESSRITHRMELSRKDILLKQSIGQFIGNVVPAINDDTEDDNKLKTAINRQEGIDTKGSDNKDLFTYYESHTNLELDIDKNINPNNIPLPYIVTIDEYNKKVVAIRRNWEQNDNAFNRIQYFVQYQYLPSFGLYAWGLAHLLGSNAITLTSIQRQLIDAGTLKNFPGGLKAAGMRIKSNNKAVGPAEFLDIETGGRPIQEALMLMPYAEPSIVLAQLRDKLIEETRALGSVTSAVISENNAQAPVGTTLALLDIAHRGQSAILRGLHFSLGIELTLLSKLFGKYLGDMPYPFSLPNSQTYILKQDFNDQIDIIPVSDPNINTSTQRIMRAEALLKLSSSAPQLHNQREILERMYKAMGIEDINKILPPVPEPQTLDPTSEDMLLLQGAPVKAAPFQDHDAHIMVKGKFLHDLEVKGGLTPPLQAQITLNMQQHKAYKIFAHMLQEMQQNMQQQMQPQIEQLQQQAMMMPQMQMEVQAQMQQLQQQVQMQIQQMGQMDIMQIMQMPQVQNALAQEDAQAAQKEMEAQQQAQQNQLDPNKIMLEDIGQRREASHLKHQEANSKLETDVFKENLKFETEQAKLQEKAQEAQLRAQTEVFKVEHKFESDQHKVQERPLGHFSETHQ
jgi:hypothetical protein